MRPNRIQSNLPGRVPSAFTLIEVILAMAIAAAILVVVLFFYRASETLRSNLVDEAARASAARLVMERINQELSMAVSGGSASFSGASDRLQFVKLDFPALNAWTNPAGAISGPPFCMVSYSLSQNTNPGAAGLLRLEQYLGAKNAGAASSAASVAPATNDTVALASTNDQTDLQAPSTNGPPRRSGSVISQIQYLRFRYWDSTNWLDSWTAAGLPAGVEVSLGNDPMPEDTLMEDTDSQEYPYDLFRRVIYVPNHTAAPAGAGADAVASSGEVAP